MSLQARRLTELAQRVVDTWKDKSESLSKIAADVAKGNHLNSEEINRVIEGANTLAMLHLYKKSNDKTVEFPIAKKEEVEAYLNPKVESDFYDKEVKDYTKPAEKKEEMPVADGKEPLEITLKKAASFLERTKRNIEEIEVRREQAQQRVVSGINKLAHLLRQGQVKFDEFENICLHKFGSVAKPLLDVLAGRSYGNNNRLLEKQAFYKDNQEFTSVVSYLLRDLDIIKEADTKQLRVELRTMEQRLKDWGSKYYVQ